MGKRRRHKNRQHNNQQQQQSKSVATRHIVPMLEWMRYERFKEYLPQIDEAIHELQDEWNNQVAYLCDELKELPENLVNFDDIVKRVIDLIRGTDIPSKKSRRQSYFDKQYDSSEKDRVSNRLKSNLKNKYANMVAEIIIEDISDQPPLCK